MTMKNIMKTLTGKNRIDPDIELSLKLDKPLLIRVI